MWACRLQLTICPFEALRTTGWHRVIHGADGTESDCVGYLWASTKFAISNVLCSTCFPVFTGQSISAGFAPLTDGVCTGRQTIERRLASPKVALGSEGIAAPPGRVAISGKTTMEVRSTEYKAMKAGICARRGRQPPAGLTPCSLNRAMISWFICWRSFISSCRSCTFAWSCLYFCWIFFCWGASVCMAVIERICFRVKGINTARTATVSKMIATPYEGIAV